MLPGQPSRTALGAAGHRAVHQVLEQGSIFKDPLAIPILGIEAEAILREAEQDPSKLLLRLFIAVRTRFAEEALATAVAQGVEQLVVLGAGLDTYAYRTALGDRLRIFEVDHPATQAWKRECLAAAGIHIPEFLTFAPVDFERETLPTGLAAAGFDRTRRTFFTWLGVVPYLTPETVFSTLSYIAGIPGGAQVVFDYADPPASIPNAEGRAQLEALAARVASVGEAFRSYFDANDLGLQLRQLGFREVEDLGPEKLVTRYFPGDQTLRARGGHVLRASTF